MRQAYKALPSTSVLWEMFDYKPLTGELVLKQPAPQHSTKGRKKHIYRHHKLNGFGYKTHRLIWCWVTGEDPGQDTIDHRDLNRHNNAWNNLRKITLERQAWNKGLQKNNKLRVRGVQRVSNGSYRARIRIHGKGYHLGCFPTIEEASAAYEKAFLERDHYR